MKCLHLRPQACACPKLCLLYISTDCLTQALPANAKIAKDAKETIQECVSEFISFITSECAPAVLLAHLGAPAVYATQAARVKSRS